MESLGTLFTLGMIACGGGLVLGSLYVLAVRLRDECEFHDLVRKAQKLRDRQARRAAMLDDIEPGSAGGSDVEIISDAA